MQRTINAAMAMGSTLQSSGTAGMTNSDEMSAGQRRHSVTHDETKVCAFAARQTFDQRQHTTKK